MISEEKKNALRVFHVSIQEIDSNITMVRRNLRMLHEYIVRNLAYETSNNDTYPFEIIKSPPPHSPEDLYYLVDSFSRLDSYASQFPHLKGDIPSSRFHFVVRCAKGGLVGNNNYFIKTLGKDMTSAFETWRTLDKELKAAGETDETFSDIHENLDLFMHELGDKYSAIEKALNALHWIIDWRKIA